jgi:signal transduction histidine kinase
MSREDQQHLFDRFFRGKNAINIKGTGLGLHIVSKYVQLLSGKIKCHSELNRGTEFIVSLPINSNQ